MNTLTFLVWLPASGKSTYAIERLANDSTIILSSDELIHMQPFFWKEQKTHDKYRKFFGERLYNNLMILHECDKIASGTREKS